MKYRRVAYVFSTAIVLATAIWLVMHGGPREGIDFKGGTMLQIRTAPAMQADEVRASLDAGGLRGVEIQQMTGEAKDEFLIRVASEAKDPFTAVQAALATRHADVKVELRRIETVGSKVGGDLRHKALMAILTSLGVILLYVGWRYEFKFALGGVVALLHDVFVTLGCLMFTGRELSLTVIAALLTIAGYSINDTIVVFDRIRENLIKRRGERFDTVVNHSIMQTLDRSLNTTLTVLFTLLALVLFGGGTIRHFVSILLIGIFSGAYSSIFNAAQILVVWEFREWRTWFRRKPATATA
jgi:preprotein translocase subunit SecF